MITMTNGHTATQEFKNQYNQLMMDTFGFSLEKWHNLNVWDDTYENYTIKEENMIIANVSIFKMRIVIGNVERTCIQIGGVATKKEYRGKGYSRKIMEHILGVYPDAPGLLFAADDACNFYPKFGFTPIVDKQPYIDYQLDNIGEMTKLEVLDPKVDQYLKERKQFSKVFDCKDQYAINWFHISNIYPNNIYEIEQLGVMIIARQVNNVLTIFDIVSKEPVTFVELIPHLHFSGINKIKFGFNPDRLSIDYLLEDIQVEDSTLFIKDQFLQQNQYIVPMLTRV